MLAGYLPFDDPNMNALFNKIERGEYRMAKYFSAEAKDLISKLLVVDPSKRLTLDEIIAHPWFRVNWDEEKFKAMMKGTQKINPSNKQCDDAITNAEESQGPTAKANEVPSTALDAFDIISRLTSGSLNPLVSASPGAIVKRATRFIAGAASSEVQSKVLDALQAMKSNPKAKDGAPEIKGFINSAKGLMTYSLEILPTVSQGLVLVEIRRTRGDTLDFHEFYRKLLDALGPLVISKSPVPEE